MYILIDFPEIQYYQEIEGFEENSYAAVDVNGAFFVKVSWIMKHDEGKAISLIGKAFGELPFSKRDLHIIETEMDQVIPFEGGMTTREALVQIYYNQLRK